MLKLVVPVVALAVLAPSAAAPAIEQPSGVIVYVCLQSRAQPAELCAVSPASGRKRVLTRNSSDAAYYASPSISSDGSRLAYVFGARAYAARGTITSRRLLAAERVDALAVLPSGGRVLLLTRVPLCQQQRERCKFTGYTGGIVDWAGGRVAKRPFFLDVATWFTNDSIVGTQALNRSSLLRLPAAGCCGRQFLRDGKWIFRDVAVSPDASRLAVSAQPTAGSGAFIALIDRATKRMTFVTRAPRNGAPPIDYAPAWSPDGRWLVFSRGQINAAATPELVVARAQPAARVAPLGVRGADAAWGRTLLGSP